MGFSTFIAARYLTSRSKRTFISLISMMSVLGVAIGVAALVIVMSVYNGVTTEMREKILGANPHVLVSAMSPGAFDPGEGKAVTPVLDRVLSVPGVKAAAPFLYAEVLFSTPGGATGLVVRGIDPAQVPAVLVYSHGPFTWGKDAMESVHNAVVMEEVAMMAWHTEALPQQQPRECLPDYVRDKHFLRKHGPNAYYGQAKK